MPPQLERFPSGQREQTVNLPRKLRRFESFPLHQFNRALIFSALGNEKPVSGYQATVSRAMGCHSKGKFGGRSSMVEPQPSKLMVRVRFPPPAPVLCLAHVAQG